ncbi:TPA: hypothetical protein DCE37_03580 [Candidatus Latescibacteria bacterium]|nr:hypothetical protein [Candidatus Latescibacterota bacterium]
MTTLQLEDERKGSVWPYLCWAVSLAIGFYDLVYVREVIVSVLIVSGIDSKLLLLVDKVGFFLFAASGLLVILLTEPYLRNGWKQRTLLARFSRLVALGFGVLTLSWAALMGLPGLADHARPSVVELVSVSVLFAVTDAWHGRTLSSQADA